MDLKRLRYFAAVAELGSYKSASQRLNVVQPALSRQVKLLEEELGLALFRRDGRGVRLTDAGEVLLEHAHTLAQESARIVDDMRARSGSPKGHVVIGLHSSLAAIVVPDLIRRVRADLPMVTIGVVEGLSRSLTDQVLNRTIDAALLTDYPAQSRGLLLMAIGVEDIAVVERVDPAQAPAFFTLDALMAKPLVLSNVFGRFVSQKLGQDRPRFNSPVTIDSMQAIRTMVLRGDCATIMPVSMFAEEIAAGTVSASAVSEAGVQRQLMLVRSSLDETSVAARAVTRLVEAIIVDAQRRDVFTIRRRPAAAVARTRKRA